jgi:hypothetical protein
MAAVVTTGEAWGQVGLQGRRGLARHEVDRVIVDLGPDDRRRGRDPAVGGRQEQGLLGRAATDQGVDDDTLAFEVGLAPHLHGAGGLQQLALVDPAQDRRAAEVVDPDIESEAAQGVELVLRQRRVAVLVHRMGHVDQIVHQQGFSIRLRHLGAFAGGQGVAIADRPASIRKLGGFAPVAFERLDQFDGGARDLVAGFHRPVDPK